MIEQIAYFLFCLLAGVSAAGAAACVVVRDPGETWEDQLFQVCVCMSFVIIFGFIATQIGNAL